MKPYYALLCLVIASDNAAFCQSPGEQVIVTELFAVGADQVKGLETVLKAPKEYSALVLCVGAGVAYKEKRIEDSAFLFYASRLRARFDQMCFPPKEKGGDSPLLVYTAVSQQLGSEINPAAMGEPKAFARALARLKRWNPKAPKEYVPGYEFTERLSEKDAHEAAKPTRTAYLSRMEDLSTLLNDPEYFAAFRVVQSFNLASTDKRPSKAENEKSIETMKRIEKDRNLKGILGK